MHILRSKQLKREKQWIKYYIIFVCSPLPLILVFSFLHSSFPQTVFLSPFLSHNPVSSLIPISVSSLSLWSFITFFFSTLRSFHFHLLSLIFIPLPLLISYTCPSPLLFLFSSFTSPLLFTLHLPLSSHFFFAFHSQFISSSPSPLPLTPLSSHVIHFLFHPFHSPLSFHPLSPISLFFPSFPSFSPISPGERCNTICLLSTLVQNIAFFISLPNGQSRME